MTEIDFFTKALLLIASNSTFAIDWQNGDESLSHWARKVESAATVLLDIAVENRCVTIDEPTPKDKPP